MGHSHLPFPCNAILFISSLPESSVSPLPPFEFPYFHEAGLFVTISEIWSHGLGILRHLEWGADLNFSTKQTSRTATNVSPSCIGRQRALPLQQEPLAWPNTSTTSTPTLSKLTFSTPMPNRWDRRQAVQATARPVLVAKWDWQLVSLATALVVRWVPPVVSLDTVRVVKWDRQVASLATVLVVRWDRRVVGPDTVPVSRQCRLVDRE